MLDLLPTYAVVYIYVLVGLFGLVMGSAFNCLSYRIAHQEKWSGDSRSICPNCGHMLSWKDLIPLFSYIFLKGKCRYCGKKISVRYPVSEFVLSVCYMSILAVFGLSLHALSVAVLCSCLFCLSLVDFDVQIIPDRFLIIPAAVRTLELFYFSGFSGTLRGILCGVVLSGTILIISLIMDKILNKDTMGGGDIKLLAVLGMYFTFSESLLLLIFSCIVGIVIGVILLKKNSETVFPFGPALSIAAWVTLLFGDSIIRSYFSLYQ